MSNRDGLTFVLFASLIAVAACTNQPQTDASRSPGRVLETLPYVASTRVAPATAGKSGTTIYDRRQAYAGYNLYTLYTHPAAYLVDMDGRIVHRWSSEIGQPQSELERKFDFMRGWQYAVMLPTGELLAVINRGYLLKLDWDSNLVWKQPLMGHHDVTVSPDGRIVALADRFRTVGRLKRLVLDDLFHILDDSGRIEDTISLYDVLNGDHRFQSTLDTQIQRRYAGFDRASRARPLTTGPSPSQTDDLMADARLMLAGAKTSRSYTHRESVALIRSFFRATNPVDVFHTNTVSRVRAHPAGLWGDGDLLVSVNHFSLVAVISRTQKRVLWSLRGVTHTQHQPSMLPNNNILVFDNGVNTRRSRVIEIDPTTNRIVWQYDGGAKKFFSETESGAQQLPNGNVHIAIAREGRAVEVTRDGQVVWEFLSPLRESQGTPADQRERFTLYRMTRLETGLVEPLLAKSARRDPR